MIKVFLSRIIRLFYREGKTYRVLWGKNKGFRFIFRNDLNTDMMLGLHEPNTFEVFDIFVREGMVVADVGSNIGYFTRYLSKKVGATGRVFAFEPIPATFQRLNETISLNELSNVEPVSAAVSNTEEPVTIFLSHTHYMASLDPVWAGQQGGNISVNAVTLDSFFEEKGIKPDLIKMDIEGGAVFALEGMRDIILRYEPVLFLESHTPEEDLAIGKALSLKPYKVFRVGASGEVKYLDKNYKDPQGVYGTVIGIPVSRMDSFGDWSPHAFQKKRPGQR
jgi:FkbM family methyltransferase